MFIIHQAMTKTVICDHEVWHRIAALKELNILGSKGLETGKYEFLKGVDYSDQIKLLV